MLFDNNQSQLLHHVEMSKNGSEDVLRFAPVSLVYFNSFAEVNKLHHTNTNKGISSECITVIKENNKQ